MARAATEGGAPRRGAPDHEAESRDRPDAAPGHEEEGGGEQAQEVPVPHRAPSAVPVVGDHPDVEEHEEASEAKASQPRRVRGPRTRRRGRRRRRARSRRARPRSAHPEVAEVAQERRAHLLRGPERARLRGCLSLVLPFDERAQVLRRHPEARVVEGHVVVFEREAAVERLALASLVVHLAGEDRVQARRARAP